MKIDIPKILLDLRAEVKQDERRDGRGRMERLVFKLWAWVMCHPRIYEMAAMAATGMAPAENGKWLRSVPAAMNLPPVRAWLSQRDLPPAPGKSFRDLWRKR